MRRLLPAGTAAVLILVLAGCGSGGGATGSTTALTTTPAAAAAAATRAEGREVVTLSVPSSLRGGELSSPRRLEVPQGWKARVWARPSGARMEAVTPEGISWSASPATAW